MRTAGAVERSRQPRARVARAGPPCAAADPEAARAVRLERARSIASCMRTVELAEAELAAWYADADGRGARSVRARSRRTSHGSPEQAFARLLNAVGALCIAWQLFVMRTAAEGLDWWEPLRRALPGLFDAESSHPDGLRQDTAFSYALAKTADDVASLFRWRFAGGCCAPARED